MNSEAVVFVDAIINYVNFACARVGNMTSLTDPPMATTPAGNTTTWQYDALDRVTKETNALGYARSFVYDAVGNLTQRTDRNGRVMKYAYDRLDRQTTEEWYANAADPSADRTLSYTYDLAGRLLSTSDPDHASTYEFDALDRMTSQANSIMGLTPSVSYAGVFDASGNRRQLSATIDSTADYRNNYAYDGLDRLTSLTQQDVGGGNAVADKRIDFAYDLAGQLDSIKRYKDVAGGSGNAVASSGFTFDKAGRLTAIDHRVGSTPGSGTQIAGYGYTWNQRGELKTLNFVPTAYNAEDVTYSYDLRGQLTGANYTSQTDETYAYDDNGNRETVTNVNGASQDYDTIGDNRLSDDDTFTYTYDNEGNRLTRVRKSSASADDKTVEYTWDHRNRLVKVTFKNNAGTVTKTVDNAYDADNQWIKRVVDPDGATGSAAVQQTVFIHERGQIALQFDKTGSGDLTAGNLSHRYLWANAVDELLADEQVDWSDYDADGAVLWALTDHLGSVRDLVDNNASLSNHISYDSYGNVTAESNSSVDVLFGWEGHPFDTATGLVLTDNRPYDPRTGNFIAHDPIESDVNSYRFVGNKVTSFVDPDGLEEQTPPRQRPKRAYDLMREMNQEHGVYQRQADFAADVEPVLEKTAEVIAETNPISGTILSECRIGAGYDPLQDREVGGAERRNEALWTFGLPALGAIIGKAKKLGRIFGEAAEATKAEDLVQPIFKHPGSKGHPDHQAIVRELEERALGEAGVAERVERERRIRGYDSSRCPDIQIIDENDVTRKIYEAERHPTRKRNRLREAEYDKLGIPYETHPLQK